MQHFLLHLKCTFRGIDNFSDYVNIFICGKFDNMIFRCNFFYLYILTCLCFIKKTSTDFIVFKMQIEMNKLINLYTYLYIYISLFRFSQYRARILYFSIYYTLCKVEITGTFEICHHKMFYYCQSMRFFA